MISCVIVSDEEEFETAHSFDRVPCVGELIEPTEGNGWPDDATAHFWRITDVLWTLTQCGARPMLTVERAQGSGS